MGSKKQLGKTRREWDDKIRRPLAVTSMIKGYYAYIFAPENVRRFKNDFVVRFAGAAILNWRKNHETIYAFDPDLFDSLVASGMPEDPAPVDVFSRFPHEAPLFLFGSPIQINEGQFIVEYEGFILDRCWVTADDGIAPGVVEVARQDDGTFPMPDGAEPALRLIFLGHDHERFEACIVSTATIPLRGMQWTTEGKVDLGQTLNRLLTIDPSEMNDIDEWGEKNSSWHSNRSMAEAWRETQAVLFPAAVASILYVCSDQPDFTRVAQPRVAGKGKVPNAGFKMIDVGMRIGAALRNSRSLASNSPSTGSGRPKAPHIRRGHWHRFWTGPRDGERKVVIRWLPPIPVNLDKGLVISTIRPVVRSDDAA